MCPAVQQLESIGGAAHRSPAQPEPAGSGLSAGVCRSTGGANFSRGSAVAARLAHTQEGVGSNPTPATIYRRRGRARLDHSLSFLGRCPTCDQTFTGAVEANVRTSIGGHHYFVHSVRLTDAELDAAVQELVTETEMAAGAEESRQPRLPLET